MPSEKISSAAAISAASGGTLSFTQGNREGQIHGRPHEENPETPKEGTEPLGEVASADTAISKVEDVAEESALPNNVYRLPLLSPVKATRKFVV
jgi:hypothetical protein